MENESRTPAVIILVATLAGFGYCLWKIAHNPTANEALLLSMFMTVLSVLASWIVSRYYAKASYEDSLRVFALKAAEKVTNLSAQLDRLANFLQESLDEQDFPTPGDELLAKSIRFEDAIHLLTTLRSVNDTSLSDWRGIIGDELSKQREVQLQEQEEREDRLREIMERLERIERGSIEVEKSRGAIDSDLLDYEIRELRSEMRMLASQVSGFQWRPPKRKPIEAICPKCATAFEYFHNLKSEIPKSVPCPHCDAKLYAQSDGTNSVVKERKPIPETLVCPTCGKSQVHGIDPLHGTLNIYECCECHSQIRAVRSKKGINQKAVQVVAPASPGKPAELSEDMLERIREGMGQQPWPKGRSHEVRMDLGLSRFSIDCGIEELIRRGIFVPQVDGVLYERAQAAAPQPKASAADLSIQN